VPLWWCWLAAGGLLWRVQGAERRQIDAADTALNGYEQAARELPLDPVADADLQRLLPWLDQARALSHGFDNAASASPAWWRLGLSQQQQNSPPRRTRCYRHALERALLPRLVWRLEAQLRGNMNQPDFLYEATRVYLIARQCRAAGPRPCACGDGAGLADLVSGRRVGADGARPCCITWTRCWRSRCRRFRWMARWWFRRAARSPACRWRNGPYSRIRPSAAAQLLPPVAARAMPSALPA